MPGFTEIANPLDEATSGQEENGSTSEMDMAFKTLRRALLEMTALALLKIHKPFHLYMDERKGIEKGVAHPNFGIIEKICGLFI